MRKNQGGSNFQLAWKVFVALVVIVSMVTCFAAICINTYGAKKRIIIPKQKSLWEENQGNPDALDMSKILKKYLIRSI